MVLDAVGTDPEHVIPCGLISVYVGEPLADRMGAGMSIEMLLELAPGVIATAQAYQHLSEAEYQPRFMGSIGNP